MTSTLSEEEETWMSIDDVERTVIPIKISKLDAAERQLCLAIRLLFDREDRVGVHTLVSAASQVLRDLAKQRGFASPIRESDLIRPERRKEWIAHLNRTQNFFKHADQDPDGTLDFYADATPWLILEAVLIHNYLTSGFEPETLTFICWMNLKYPSILREGAWKAATDGALAMGVNVDDFEVIKMALNYARAQYATGVWPPKGIGATPSASRGTKGPGEAPVASGFP